MVNLFLLLFAITLEVCGDASIRIGLRAQRPWSFLLGSLLVIAYGVAISLPKWNFSRTMGVYIAMFFVVSQIVSASILHERIRLPIIVGGFFIVLGGFVILLWRPEY